MEGGIGGGGEDKIAVYYFLKFMLLATYIKAQENDACLKELLERPVFFLWQNEHLEMEVYRNTIVRPCFVFCFLFWRVTWCSFPSNV